MNRGGFAADFYGIPADLVPAFAIDLGTLDIVEPAVAQSRDAAKAGFDVVRRKPDRYPAGLYGLRLDGDMLETRELAVMRDVVLTPKAAHHVY
jgi:hypothetical protein